MKITCISASNVKRRGNDSTSIKVGGLAEELLKRTLPSLQTETIPLMNYNLKPCFMCGDCAEDYICKYDKDFNKIYDKIVEADGFVVICPHYAPIPAKLTILLEKLEEFCYIAWCRKVIEAWPLKGKQVGIIAHGGQVGDVHTLYKTALLDPLENVFKAIGMQVIWVDQDHPNGVTFGVKGYTNRTDAVFPDMVHDQEEINKKVNQLVQALVRKLQA